MLAQSARPLHSTPSASQRLQCWHALALQETSIASANDAAFSMRTAVPACNRQRPWQLQCSRGQCQAASAAKQNSSPHHGNPRPMTFDVSRTWDGLIGWEVLLQRNGFYIGTVREVIQQDPGSLGSPLLRVVNKDTPVEYGPDAVEEHLIPLVDDIVPESNSATRTLYVSPPHGLLQLGRQRMVLGFLRDALLDLEINGLAPVTEEGLGDVVVSMPTREQLMNAGKSDLVRYINDAGGFLEVAQQLGFRSRRRPSGYWESEEHLDREIAQFVAAHWTQMDLPDSGETYWYNQVTGRVQWVLPQLPHTLELDDSGSRMWVEPAQDRVMPSRSTLLAAGRYDLHHAIKYHGGYVEAGKALGRQASWPRFADLTNSRVLAKEIRGFQRDQGADEALLPTARALLESDRADLLQAIRQLGGFLAAARVMRFRTARQPRSRWKDFAAVVAELRLYIDAQPEGRRGSMPTNVELLQAGRGDLRYAVQLHRHLDLAEALDVMPSSRGGHHKLTFNPGDT